MKNLSKRGVLSAALCAALIATCGHLQAQTLVDYNPADNGGTNGNNSTSTSNPLTPSNVSPLITATGFTRGAGTSGYDNAGGASDFFGAYYTGGSDATLGDAVSNNIYLTFSITAGATSVRVTGLTLTNDFYYQNVNTYSVEDSIQGFGASASNVLASYGYTGSGHAPGSVVTFAHPEQLAPGATETFRLYINGLNTYTDFGIGDGGSTPGNKNPFEVNGGVIPEPGTYALLGLGLAFLVLAVRHRRALVS